MSDILAKRIAQCVLALLAASGVGGCGRSRHQTVDRPPVDPTAAARQALELYDKDGSATLDAAELGDCPGILAAFNRYDSDDNRQISEEEIAARLRAIYDSGTPWVSASCQFYRSGKPLAGAKVQLVPEPFLADALHPASGITDNLGRTIPATADEKLPVDKRGLHIVRPGNYRVEIEHPGIKQPHKPLGCEIDPTARGGTELVFRL